MRFHLGQPPATPDFEPCETGWTPLREPGPLVVQLIATPVGLAVGALLALAWKGANIRFELGQSVLGPIAPLVYLVVACLIGLPLLILVHELIHALAYPKFGLTAETMIACWPSKLLFLAIHFAALRRNHLLLVYVLPLISLSLVPLVLCRSLGLGSGLWMVISVVNGLMSGGDIFCFFLILSQVPSTAQVRNQGWATWWKVE